LNPEGECGVTRWQCELVLNDPEFLTMSAHEHQAFQPDLQSSQTCRTVGGVRLESLTYEYGRPTVLR
jgi:hypothetical protein